MYSKILNEFEEYSLEYIRSESEVVTDSNLLIFKMLENIKTMLNEIKFIIYQEICFIENYESANMIVHIYSSRLIVDDRRGEF